MKTKVSLDNKPQEKKLSAGQIVASKRRACNNWKEIDIKELANLVGNHGHSYVPGHLVGGIRAANCTEMQLFSLDFDDDVSFQEVRQQCDEYGLPITFAYHTFSSSETKERFRVVFVHEYLVDDPYIITVMNAIFYRIFLGGKELIYLDGAARFSYVQLLFALKKALSKGGHYKRGIETFCKEQKILMVNGTPAMGSKVYLQPIQEEIGENMESITKHIVGESSDSPFLVVENKGLHKNIIRKIQQVRRDVSGDSCCQLLSDFNAGEELNHLARFAILTNLMNIIGGEKHFYDILEKYYSPETTQKWKKDIIYIKGIPMQCSDSFCPYYNTCGCKGTIYNALSMNRKIERVRTEKYSTIEDAYDCMIENLEDALNSSTPGFYLIKAQTSLGKTKAYIELICKYLELYPDMKFLIAVPTNALKKQVVKDLRTQTILFGNNLIYMTSSVKDSWLIDQEVRDEIEVYHSGGLHNVGKGIIRKYCEERMKKEPEAIALKEECEKILDGIRGIKKERVVVTTHAFMMNCPESFLKQYCIIVDEDILYMQIFNNTHRISTDLLEEVIVHKISGYSDIALQMLNAKENEYTKLIPQPYIPQLTEQQIFDNDLWCDSQNDLNDIANAGSFVKKEGSVQYFCPQTLPELKYIVLSATLNENLYRRYFGKKWNVYMYPERKAVYKGKVVQYPYHILGRSSLEKKLEVFDLAREISGNPEIDIITFKKFEKEAHAERHHMHFGNTTGINSLQGRSLAVVGTPYKAEEAYKLIGCYLGSKVNGFADQRPTNRRIEYKDYSFPIVTYEDDLLRELQLFSFESELEQAIGRARLLRHDCTVYVFSAFPCEQAKLCTENYLLDYQKTGTCKNKYNGE